MANFVCEVMIQMINIQAQLCGRKWLRFTNKDQAGVDIREVITDVDGHVMLLILVDGTTINWNNVVSVGPDPKGTPKVKFDPQWM